MNFICIDKFCKDLEIGQVLDSDFGSNLGKVINCTIFNFQFLISLLLILILTPME